MSKVSRLEKAAAKAALTFFLFSTVWIAALIYTLVYLSPVVSITVAALPVALMILKGTYVAFIAEVEDE